MGRFETEILTTEENRCALARLNSSWVSSALANTRTRRIILDMDSSESTVHGNQEGSRYNGHFESVCYHPLFCFNQYGDCEGAMLREGNVSSADRWLELLTPIVQRYRGVGLRMLFRGDAGFASPDIYEYLEEEGYEYAIRLPANQVLDREIELLLIDQEIPGAGHPVVVYHDFCYQAGTWDNPACDLIGKTRAWADGKALLRLEGRFLVQVLPLRLQRWTNWGFQPARRGPLT